MREKQTILQQIAAKKNGKKLVDIHEVKKKQTGFPDLYQSDLLPLIHRRIANIKKPAAYSVHLSAQQNNIKNKLNEKESQQTINNTDLFNREAVENKVKRIGTVKPIKPFTMTVEGQPNNLIKKQSIHNKRTSLEIRQSNREMNNDQKNPYLKDQILMEKMKKKSQQKIIQKQKQNQSQQISKKKNKIKKKNKKLKPGNKKQELLQKQQKQLGSFQQQANKSKRQEEIPINSSIFLDKNKLRTNNHKQKSYNIVINMVSNREQQSNDMNSAKDIDFLPEVKKQYSIVQYEEDQFKSRIPSEKSIPSNINEQQLLTSSKLIKTPSKRFNSKHTLNSSNKSINKMVNFISKASKLQTNGNIYEDKIDQSLPFCNKVRIQKKSSVNLQKIRIDEKNQKQVQIKDRRPSYFKVSSQSFKINDSTIMNNNSTNGYLKKCPINQLNFKQKIHKINPLRKQSNAKQMKLNEYLQQAKQICKNNSLYY